MTIKSNNILLQSIVITCILSFCNQVYAANTLQEAINDSTITSYTLTNNETYSSGSYSTGSIGVLNSDRTFEVNGGGKKNLGLQVPVTETIFMMLV